MISGVVQLLRNARKGVGHGVTHCDRGCESAERYVTPIIIIIIIIIINASILHAKRQTVLLLLLKDVVAKLRECLFLISQRDLVGVVL